MNFNHFKKNLKKDFSAFQKVRVAVLGDSATQLLVTALRGYGYEQKIDFQLFEADYDQVERQIFDTNSEMYHFEPEYVLICQTTEHLSKKFYYTTHSERAVFWQNHLQTLGEMCQTISQKNKKTKIFYLNFYELNDGIFGNFANKVNYSFLYQVRKINTGLMELGQELRNLFIIDLASLLTQYGHKNSFDSKFYINADMVWGLEFLPMLAKRISDTVQSISGKIKKALILDLDNTVWGGIVGDDGWEGIQIGNLGMGKAFTNLQIWAKELKKRGIILCVCSKNDEKIAKEAFEKNPDMVLKLEDIAVFVANWDNKADNIRQIQEILNIGMDSLVFLDDNPFERNMVRENLPEVCVPELPEDPAEYVSFLQELNLFETASVSDNDEIRTKQYQEESVRLSEKKHFANEEEFLANLQMEAKIQPISKFNVPRVAQLTQRSNQFNLRTVRYTEQDIEQIAKSENFASFTVSLKDKFGEYGLISMVILEKKQGFIFIDTWIMSCRVLKRGVEALLLNEMVKFAQNDGLQTIIGEYLPTAKNGLVKDHYQNLGFSSKDKIWELDCGTYQLQKHFIKHG